MVRAALQHEIGPIGHVGLIFLSIQSKISRFAPRAQVNLPDVPSPRRSPNQPLPHQHIDARPRPAPRSKYQNPPQPATMKTVAHDSRASQLPPSPSRASPSPLLVKPRK